MDSEALYIRNPPDAKAQGPVSIRQLAALAELGQVSAQTLVWDANHQEWVSIGSQPELMRALPPARPKLALRTGSPASSDSNAAKSQPLEVHELLAAARGEPAKRASWPDAAAAIDRATTMGRYGAVVGLLLSAISMLPPAAEALADLSAAQLLAHPLAGLGILDLILGAVLALGVTSFYPLIRLRAASGLGFAGFIFYAQGRGMELAMVVGGCSGIFLCTLVRRTLPAILASALSAGSTGLLVCSTLASR